jgi:hypothetical protein
VRAGSQWLENTAPVTVPDVRYRNCHLQYSK